MRSLEDSLLAWWTRRAREAGATWFGRAQTALFESLDRELPLLEALIDTARESPRDARDIRVLDIVAGLWPYWSLSGRVVQATDLMQEFLERVSSVPTPEAQSARFNADWALAWFALADADLVLTDAIIADATDAAGRWRTPAQEAALDQLIGIRDLYAGDAASALDRLEHALRYDLDSGHDDAVYIDLSFLGAAASMAGDQELAFDYCERAIAFCDERGERWLRCYVVWAFALSAWRIGQPNRALTLAIDGLSAAAEFTDRYAAMVCADVIGWVECVGGDARAGARMLGIAEGLRAQVVMPADFWGIGEERHRAEARGVARVGGGAYEAARESGRAAQTHDPQTWKAAAAALVAGQQATRLLTPRQQEIAELIAEGRSNKEIARVLLITVRTVETHIEHIFEKLGAISRSQVAAWVARKSTDPLRG